MRKLKKFNELYDIQDKAYHDACTSDLCLLRTAYRLWDGYLVICTNETISDAKKGTFYIDDKDYIAWTNGEKGYFKWYYLHDYNLDKKENQK